MKEINVNIGRRRNVFFYSHKIMFRTWNFL